MVVEPPGIEDFQFSDYSSDNHNFEDSKETQSSDSDSDGNDTQLVKRKAGSPLSQEDFKKHKGYRPRKTGQKHSCK